VNRCKYTCFGILYSLQVELFCCFNAYSQQIPGIFVFGYVCFWRTYIISKIFKLYHRLVEYSDRISFSAVFKLALDI